MAKAYRADHLEHAIWGYQAETGLHGLRLITGGVFDRFPKLQVVLGHMGEGIPYWLYRLDFMYGRVKIDFGRRKLKLTPSEYFKRNFYITTSGMNWEPTLKFCIEALGADRIMWAIDYPYQDHPDAVEFMDAARISEKDKQAIYHGNAERVFKIKKTK
jgi:predicted TIM-barrel fold metal-dependent hydrolase